MAAKKKRRPTPPPPPVSRKPPRAATRPAGPTRREVERDAQARQERSEALKRKLVAGGLTLAALAAVGGYVLSKNQASDEVRDALTSGSCTVDEKADRISGGDGHVASPTYTVNPPAGGDHLASAARGGVYAGTSVPADGLLVHAQEHGYVVVWHQPGLPAPQLEALTTFQGAHAGDVIVAERADLPTAVAVTAWNKRLLCGAVEAGPLQRFFDEHVGDGPEDVPRG